MNEFKNNFEARRREYESIEKKTTNVKLDYLVDQIDTLFNFIGRNFDCINGDTRETKKKEDLHAALKIELEEMGLPEHYVGFKVLDDFLTRVENGLITFVDDEDLCKVQSKAYECIEPEQSIAWTKRALTAMRKTVDFSKSNKFGFDNPSSKHSNDALLINMYNYIVNQM